MPRTRLHHSAPASTRWRRWLCLVSALLLLTPFLGLVFYVAQLWGDTAHLRLLLFPPLAVIGYTLFLHPYSRQTNARNVIVGPVIGALVGAAAVAWLPPSPLRVTLVAAVTIVALDVLRIQLAMPLAVALLAVLLGVDGVAYIVSVTASVLALMVLFRVWRRVIYAPFRRQTAGRARRHGGPVSHLLRPVRHAHTHWRRGAAARLVGESAPAVRPPTWHA